MHQPPDLSMRSGFCVHWEAILGAKKVFSTVLGEEPQYPVVPCADIIIVVE
jgi:hypothetical protein